MKEFLLSVLIFNINFTLLIIGYYFLVRKETNYKLNRFILLLIGVLPFFLPLLKNFKAPSTIFPQAFMDTITISAGQLDSTLSQNIFIGSFGIYEIISGVFISGCIFFFVKNMVALIVLLIQIKKCEKERSGNYTLVKNF